MAALANLKQLTAAIKAAQEQGLTGLEATGVDAGQDGLGGGPWRDA